MLTATVTLDGKTYSENQTLSLDKAAKSSSISNKQASKATHVDTVDTGINTLTGVYASVAAISAGLFLTLRKHDNEL